MVKRQLTGSIKVSHCIGLFFILCVVFMLSCGVKIIDPSKTGPAKTLQKNSFALDQEHGFTALAVWSFRIVDQTGDLKGMNPKFTIGPIGATERLCKYLSTGKVQEEIAPKEYLASRASVKPINGSWTEKNGQAIYNALFAVQLRPGEHQIFQVLIESKTTSRERWLNIPLNGACRIEQGKVYDLKLLEVIISERVSMEGRKGTFYRHSIHTPALETSNSEKLSQLYPALSLPKNSIVSDCSFMVPVCVSQ